MKSNRRCSTLAWLALAATCALGTPRIARADGDDAATRDAKVRFEEGLKRYEAQDYDGARLAFLQAYAVLHAVDILFNLSLSELRSERPVDALHHLKTYLRDDRITPQERERATKYLAEAHGKTGHVWIEATAGSKLSVDAQVLETVAPLKEAVDVVVGRRVVEVQTGGLKRSLEVNAVAGETVTARFVGDDQPILVAGAPTSPGKADPPAKEQPERATGFWTTRNVTTIALAGGALVGFGVGVGFTVGAGSQSDKAKSAATLVPDGTSGCAVTSSACTALSDANHGKLSDQNIATGAFIAGGALAVGALVAFIFWPTASNSETKQTFLVPTAGPGGAGAQLVGRF